MITSRKHQLALLVAFAGLVYVAARFGIGLFVVVAIVWAAGAVAGALAERE